MPQAHGAGDRLIFAPNRTADVLVVGRQFRGWRPRVALLAVNKQPREAPTFDGTTDEGYAVVDGGGRGLPGPGHGPASALGGRSSGCSRYMSCEQAKYVPVTSHLTDADKDVLGEALLKSVLAPADEAKASGSAPPRRLRLI